MLNNAKYASLELALIKGLSQPPSLISTDWKLNHLYCKIERKKKIVHRALKSC